MACIGSFLISLLCIAALAAAAASSSSYSGVYSFGDSLLDAGNNNYLPLVGPGSRCNKPPYGRAFDTEIATGRCSDGELVNDIIAKQLELPFGLPYLSPNTTGDNLLRGVNFASAGAGILPSTSLLQKAAALDLQISWFRDYRVELLNLVGLAEADRIIKNGLYFITAGSNDISFKVFNPAEALTSPTEFRHRLISRFTHFFEQAYEIGARRFIVLGLQPLGCIPALITTFRFLTRTCDEYLNKQALYFNRDLQTTSRHLERQLQGTKIIYLDVYRIASDFLSNPGKYGFVVTNRGCCNTGLIEYGRTCSLLDFETCRNGSDFTYFDAAHFSFASNRIIAAKLMDILV